MNASSQSFSLVSALLALESGDYMNFSRFSDVFADIYRVPQSPDYPAVLRLTELLMVVRNPFALVPNYPEFLGLYEKVLRRLFQNSWLKVVPFHLLVLGTSDKCQLMIKLLEAGPSSSSLEDYNMYFAKVLSTVTLLRKQWDMWWRKCFTSRQTRGSFSRGCSRYRLVMKKDC